LAGLGITLCSLILCRGQRSAKLPFEWLSSVKLDQLRGWGF